MRLTHFSGRPARSGSVLPMLGVCLIGLFGFVALAVDLGMLAVSRTQCQNGADVAALVGTRTLNNKDGVAYNNLPAAMTALKAVASNNPHLSGFFSNAQVSKIEANQYLYNTSSQRFEATEANWLNVTPTGGTVAAPNGGSWTALRVTITVNQPTYFMRVFGVTSMPSGARATAVYRPRDIAFVLDMTGSMGYASKYNNSAASMNPDTVVPLMGHYVANTGSLIETSNYTVPSTGEVYSRNNYTITTPAGPPIIRNFYFDPTNITTPATLAYPLTTKGDGSPNLLNAFHRWSPPETPGDSTNYVGQTYSWAGYDPTHKGNEGNPKGPVPAPDFYATMTDGAVPYAGDRWRRGDGKINKTNTNWGTASATTRAAYTAADLLGYNAVPTATPAFTGWENFRDPVWELYGYDLDVNKYRTQRGTGNPPVGGVPMNPATFKANNGNSDANILLPVADRFVGYSMGPAYWGKTFFIWPPDPRFDTTANLLSPDPAKPGFDTNGKAMCDWRRHFFLNKQGGAFNPQNDSDSSTTGTNNFEGINETLMTSGGNQTLSATTTTQVNYAAILKWIKSGPQTLPPNLRAGRVLYYSSIPDDVNTATATGQAQLDKAFWKNYIDFVLGVGSYTSTNNLYGGADTWTAAGASITTTDPTTYKFSWQTVGETATRPYMQYNDSPRRPRLHTWFGPMSMVGFLTRAYPNGNSTPDNWLAGTTYEAQCWQLKAGMNSVLDDVKNNHPNDYAGLVMFSTSYNGVRVGLSQNFKRLKNGLFYPKSLLTAIDGGNVTNEYRPYSDTSLNGYTDGEVPNAGGSTDPNTGLAYAFNVLSPSTITAAQSAGAGAGRRGAQKIIIFETDGVPNYSRTATFVPRGYNSYYTVSGGGNETQGSTTVQQKSFDIISQIVKQSALTATTSGTGPDSGLSLPNAPARVYPIAFGDLFDEELAPGAYFRDTAKSFLNQCAARGGTGSLPETQIITGPYSQRITRLRDCLERIFQGGVTVALIE